MALLKAIALAAFILHGCADPLCEAGRAQTCVCVGGLQGVQACNSTGSGFETCTCPSGPIPGGLCTPTQQVQCTCDGGTGLRECATDGESFGPCDCAPLPVDDVQVTADTTGSDIANGDAPAYLEVLEETRDGVDDVSPDVELDVGPSCASFASLACSGDDVSWFDSCGAPTQIMQKCLDFQPCADAACPIFPGFCFGDCPTECEMLDGATRQITPAPLGHDVVPLVTTSSSDALLLLLPPASASEFGGVFRLQSLHRLLADSGVAITLTSFDETVNASPDPPANCGQVLNVPSGSYEVTIGPTSSNIVKIVVNPQQ